MRWNRKRYFLCVKIAETAHRAISMEAAYSEHSIAIHSISMAGYVNPRTVRAPVFGRHQFFGTSEHYGKAHGSLLSGWMNYNYTSCCWFPASSNILILPSQFWQIRFESCWLHCSKCRILVFLRYWLLSAANSQAERRSVSVILKTDLLRFHRIFLLSDSSKLFFNFFMCLIRITIG